MPLERTTPLSARRWSVFLSASKFARGQVMYAILGQLCLEDTTLRSWPIYATCYHSRGLILQVLCLIWAEGLFNRCTGKNTFDLANDPHKSALGRGRSSRNNQNISNALDVTLTLFLRLLNGHIGY